MNSLNEIVNAETKKQKTNWRFLGRNLQFNTNKHLLLDT